MEDHHRRGDADRPAKGMRRRDQIVGERKAARAVTSSSLTVNCATSVACDRPARITRSPAYPRKADDSAMTFSRRPRLSWPRSPLRGPLTP